MCSDLGEKEGGVRTKGLMGVIRGGKARNAKNARRRNHGVESRYSDGPSRSRTNTMRLLKAQF